MEENGIRDGIDKKKIMKSMTKEDWKRIEEQQKFNSLEKGSRGYTLAITCDTLRRKCTKIQKDLSLALWNLENAMNTVHRHNIELKKGEYPELKPGVKMIEREFMTQIKHEKALCDGVALDIPMLLGELRTIVGYSDVAKNPILTEEQFNVVFDGVIDELKEKGYEVLENS